MKKILNNSTQLMVYQLLFHTENVSGYWVLMGQVKFSIFIYLEIYMSYIYIYNNRL